MRRNYLEEKDVCIVAYGEIKNERRSGKTNYELAAQVTEELLSKTDLRPADIDGLALCNSHSESPNPFYTSYMADYLGFAPRWSQITDIGGSSSIGNVARAAMAIQSGLCEVAMLIGTDSQTTRLRSDIGCYRPEFLNPVGVQAPPAAFGLLMNRYEAEFGLDYRGLGALAVAQRNGAVVNANAYEGFRKEITIEDYLTSRLIAAPLRLLDAVMPCDGGNGVIMMSTEHATSRGLNKRVYPVAYSELVNFKGAEQTPNVLETGFSVVGPELLAKAAMSVDDIQQFHPYDDFLIAVALQLEQIGFCKPGEGTQFLRDADLSPAGPLPINTGGGQISAGQPGLAGGGLNLVEAVRQLMNEADGRQVAAPRNALVTGIGVIPYGRNWSVSNGMILTN